MPPFLSTLSLRRATFPISAHRFDGGISIHALLAESDLPIFMRQSTVTEFLSTLSLRRATHCKLNWHNGKIISIHALLAESDMNPMISFDACGLFLSTLSLRRATKIHRQFPRQSPDFYPRSPCGERRRFRASLSAVVTISIHALLAESDEMVLNVSPSLVNFYPRSPCGERHDMCEFATLGAISIHALLAESDAISLLHGQVFGISIHALLAESDCLQVYRNL